MMTPLERAPAALEEFGGCSDLWLKREDVHELGVFKWRAAVPVVAALVAAGEDAVVTCSTGNHGAAVAWACSKVDASAIVFLPPGATERKLALLDRFGADVRVAGSDFDEAKDAARAYAAEQGLAFFEDGAEPLQYDAYEAIGDEIVDQSASPPAAVVTPIGNGALAGGIGAALGRRAPGATRIGVVAAEMAVMAASRRGPVRNHDRGRPRRARRDPARRRAPAHNRGRNGARLGTRDRGRACRVSRRRRRRRAFRSRCGGRRSRQTRPVARRTDRARHDRAECRSRRSRPSPSGRCRLAGCWPINRHHSQLVACAACSISFTNRAYRVRAKR
jgi:cysteine synthase